ncbi:MAG: DUF3575 domain-containing protein [Bacteroidales bacterium]|nr:DUF3575 domain-containing protein [Bacteroidales bacterium]
MNWFAHMNDLLSAKAFRLVAVLAMLLPGVLFSYAHAQQTHNLRVYYPFDNATLMADYMGNADTFAALDSLATRGALDQEDQIDVISYSSPEGNWNYNLGLSRRRAESLRKYLEWKYPAIKGRVTIHPDAEAWDDLREAITTDSRLSDTSREHILEIIDSDRAPDAKERMLQALPEYKRLYAKYFRQFRYASIVLHSGVSAQETEADTTAVQPADTVRTVEPRDTVIVLPPADTTAAPADTLVAPADTTAAPVDTVVTVVPPVIIPAPVDTVISQPVRKNYKTIAALKTNLLYDAVTALNFEVEVPIANRYSVMVEDVFPWWETGNKYCFQMWEMGIEGRVWLKPWDVNGTEKLRGWFGGLYAMSSKYDFQLDRKINYQGEYWSGGLTAGYAMPIGRKKKVNLEFSLSVGYLQSDYRHYQPSGDYDKLIRDKYNTGKVSYFGPTKAKISLVVPINIPTRKDKEVRDE